MVDARLFSLAFFRHVVALMRPLTRHRYNALPKGFAYRLTVSIGDGVADLDEHRQTPLAKIPLLLVSI